MNYPEPPPTPVRNVQILTEGIWLWNWIPPVFPTSVAVRPADMDGWVEQGGQLLMLDGCIGRQGMASKPSRAVTRAQKEARNITYLALACDADDFDIATHTPAALTHYLLRPAWGWNPPSYQWDRWFPITPREHSRWTAVSIIAQWAAWAVYKESEVRP